MANEKRLIDANALLRKLKQHHDLFIDAWEGFSNLPEKDKARVDEISNCIADVFNAPTVEAVEVCRCKDCVNYCGFEHCKNGICDVDSVSKRAVYPDDFCSYGERRNNEPEKPV